MAKFCAVDGLSSTVKKHVSFCAWAVIGNLQPDKAPDNRAFERFTEAGPVAMLPVADDRAECPASGGGRPRGWRAARDPGDHLMTNKPRLTDLQLVLLSSAIQRPDGMLLPPPESIRARGKTLERSLTKMLGLGLIEEHG